MRLMGFRSHGNLCALVVCVVGVVRTLGESTGNSTVDLGVSNGTNVTTARNSRQLWSLFKNVIKTGLEQGSNGAGGGGGAGGLGSIAAGLLGSAIKGGLADSPAYQQYPYPGTVQNVNPNQFANPNDYMHYLLANSQANQHSSLPHYWQQQREQETQVGALIDKYKEQMASGSENVETADTASQIVNKLAFGSLFDDLDKVTNLLSFARFEGMVDKVNKFDKLKCIPRLLCQMVSKRAEDQKKEEEKTKAKERQDISTSTTKRPTLRKADDEEVDSGDKKKHTDEDDDDKRSRNGDDDDDKRESEEDDEEEDDDDDDDDSDEVKEYEVIKKGAEDKSEGSGDKTKGRSEGRTGRFLNFNGGDLALEQMVKFLELTNLKSFSLYPYLHGAYQGHQVTRADECAYKFPTCPFSDEQLVYYFNNYNGGFFQSI